MTPRRALSYSLTALAFVLPLSISGTNLALAATSLSLLWFAYGASERSSAFSCMRNTAQSPIFVALAAYAAWALISSLAGTKPATNGPGRVRSAS